MTAPPARPDPPGVRALAAAAGLVAAAAAVGTAELVSGLVGVSSIVTSIGDGVVRLVPAPLAELAIQRLGGLNRPALITGTLAVLTLLSLGVGLLALHSLRAATAAVAAFGAIGVVSAIANPQDPFPAAVLPGLAAMVTGAAGLRVALPSLHETTASSRRAFLRTAGVLVAAAVVTTAGGRWLQVRAGAIRERVALTLPRADRPGRPLPDGVDFALDGLAPYITPNDDFYRIDTAVTVPAVRAVDWRLRIHGMVERELVLDFEQLLSRELVEADVSLVCVSNEVGGDLIGNARWRGVRLAEVLAEAGVRVGATQLVGRSVDGYTGGFPVAAALDGRNALLAVGMNGDPLPLAHGYPVRLVVPGLYGYVSAVKWLAELELTTFEAFDQYWVRRGWAEQAPVKTSSRIDRPRAWAEIPAGPRVIAGVAWAQGRGIERVEVRTDDGPWVHAELAAVSGPDTWRQWRSTWQAVPGTRRLQVRATDGEGVTQPGERVPPVPDGAEGWHTIQVTVQ